MSHRFFFQSDSSAPPQPGLTLELEPQESHHLIHVLRAKIGDPLQLFDGSGFEFTGEVIAVNRKQVEVRLLAKEFVNRELDSQLTIAIPLPKSDRQKFLVEKLTEIGVSRLVFLNTNRSSVAGNEKSIARLRRLVIEASKQCRRNRLMILQGPVALKELVENSTQHFEADSALFFAHPGESESLSLEAKAIDNDQVLVIGPEGGLDDDEVTMLKSKNWQPIQLGKTILRMETAALVGATLLSGR